MLLRLAGPMQSWGEHSTFSERDTGAYPTRSGMIGMFAAAMGRRRGEPIGDLSGLRFTIRVDRPGYPMMDFHTVGGGLPSARTVVTAEGKRRSGKTTTIVSRRHYLADAVFTVAVTGPEPVVDQVATALTRPVWSPYLGRRSCPAETPLLLRWPVTDPISELEKVPLAQDRPRGQMATLDVDFVYDSDDQHTPDATRVTVNDVPVDFHPHRRRYLTRSLSVLTRRLPADLCAGKGVQYLRGLEQYLKEVHS
jgi:CRISPR system Cascade subunit CasD